MAKSLTIGKWPIFENVRSAGIIDFTVSPVSFELKCGAIVSIKTLSLDILFDVNRSVKIYIPLIYREIKFVFEMKGGVESKNICIRSEN